VTQRTAALPSLLAALDLVAGTYWIGRRAFDADVGFAAGLIAVTTAGVFSLARSPIPDMTLSLAMVAAVGAFGAAEFEGRRGALTVFYLLVGIAYWILKASYFVLQVASDDPAKWGENKLIKRLGIDPPGAKN